MGDRVRPADVVRMTSLSLRQVQSMAASGKIPGAAKLGGVWTFDPAQVRAWIRAEERRACRAVDISSSGATFGLDASVSSGREYKRSLRTTDKKEAAVRLRGWRQSLERAVVGAPDCPTIKASIVRWAKEVLPKSVKPSVRTRYLTSIGQIERTIESPIETPVSLGSDLASPATATAPALPGAAPRYNLSTTVPYNWIPMLPVELDDHGTLVSRLKRGAILQPDGTRKMHAARTDALNASGSLLLYDEEVPREGTRITRRHRMTRWVDGSTWLWTAFRNEVGRGEGSAGLRFDQLDGDSRL